MNIDNLPNDIIVDAKMRLSCYKELIRLAKAQQSVLTSGDNSGLSHLTSEFDRVILDLQRIGSHEESLIVRFQECGRDLENIEGYTAIRHSILEQAAELRRLIRANMELLQNAIDFTQFSIDLLYKISLSEDNNLNSNGQSILFDTKA